MTSIETTPLLNPTFVTKNQNQIIESKPALPPVYALSISSMPRFIEHLETQQIDIPGIANKEKYIDRFSWRLNDTANSNLYTYELTLENLLRLAPLGTSVQSFVNIDAIELTIINTNQFAYQGSLIVYHDPSPDPAYYPQQIGTTLSLNHKWQFPDLHLIEPKNRNPLVFIIPINIPFDLFQINHPDTANQYYVRSYSFGRLKVDVNDDLVTKTQTTSLNFRVRARLIKYQTAGSAFV
jgi:hypothetical protein